MLDENVQRDYQSNPHAVEIACHEALWHFRKGAFPPAAKSLSSWSFCGLLVSVTNPRPLFDQSARVH